jgi:hypothetical protein
MLRLTGVLLVLATSLAGCSIDRIEWEQTGYAVEAATETLEEEHGVEHPQVECIKREVGGAVWECRTTTASARYTCKVHVGPREAIRKVHCHGEHEEQGEEQHEG